MEDYDNDTSQYTQSLGAWHGFAAQQTMYAKKNTLVRRVANYLLIRLDGCSSPSFWAPGPLPDQSMQFENLCT